MSTSPIITENGTLVNGDQKINSQVTTQDLNYGKKDIAQVYVVTQRKKNKKRLAEVEADLDSQIKESNKAEAHIGVKIEEFIEAEVSGKVTEITAIQRKLKSDIKALVKGASSEVFPILEGIFEDADDIDSRIKADVQAPKVSYSWQPSRRTEEIDQIEVSIRYGSHSEVKTLDVPASIGDLRKERYLIVESINTLHKEKSNLTNLINNSNEQLEEAEAAITAAHLDQSTDGKAILESLKAINNGSLLLE